MVVIWIEDFTDIFCQVLLLYGLLVVAAVKGIQTESVDGLCIPYAQGIDDIVIISDNRKIIGNCKYRLAALLDKVVLGSVPLGSYIAAEFNLGCVLGAAHLKGVAVL